MTEKSDHDAAELAEDDGANDDCGKRAHLKIGEKRYFNGTDQFDGYYTEEDALRTYRDSDCGATHLGATIEIAARQFAGIYRAEVSFGEPNERGGRPAVSWKWKGAAPKGVSFYERYNEDHGRTHSHSAGSDTNQLLMQEWGWRRFVNGVAQPPPDTTVVAVACWIDLAATRYVVELRHIGTRI